MLLDYESCCTEKWLVSYYDTNHFCVIKFHKYKTLLNRNFPHSYCWRLCIALHFLAPLSRKKHPS